MVFQSNLRLLKTKMRVFYLIFIGIFCISACSNEWSDYPTQTAPVKYSDYYIGVNDTVIVSVFGEPDLSGRYDVLADGSIQMPLIESVNIQNLTLPQAVQKIENEFKIQKYLIDPRVTVSIVQSHTVKILGEVLNAGEYSYSHGITILDIVAKAGGFLDRANQTRFDIIRSNPDGTKNHIRGVVSTYLQPGDVVRVSQRYF